MTSFPFDELSTHRSPQLNRNINIPSTIPGGPKLPSPLQLAVCRIHRLFQLDPTHIGSLAVRPSTPASDVVESQHIVSTVRLVSAMPLTPIDSVQTLALIGIQVQILMSASMAAATVPRMILAVGVMFELFGLLVGLSFPDRFHSASSPMLSYLVRVTLALPLIVGVLGLAVTINIVVVGIGVGAAAAMACTFIVGSIVYFSLLWFCARK